MEKHWQIGPVQHIQSTTNASDKGQEKQGLTALFFYLSNAHLFKNDSYNQNERFGPENCSPQ